MRFESIAIEERFLNIDTIFVEYTYLFRALLLYEITTNASLLFFLA